MDEEDVINYVVRYIVPMSKFKIVFCICLLLTVSGGSSVCADDEGANDVYVRSSKYGRYYAKCIPAEHYGTRGETRIYIVRDGDDQLLYTYPWYSRQVYLLEISGRLSLVRMGPWPTGREANREDLAIGFYFSGKTLKEYSTLDIAGTPRNVGLSASHYDVFKSIDGYRDVGNDKYAFDIVTINGRTISFDPITGEILK
jgi:hypothetical protein